MSLFCLRLALLMTLLVGLVGCATPPQAPVKFDTRYEKFNVVLSKYTTPEGVDYAGLAADPEALHTTLAQLAEVPRSQFDAWSSRAQLAFLVNAHNAGLLARVTRDWPVDSIGQTSLLWPARWRNDIELFGRLWSLCELEQAVLGRKYLDSRSIFLISLAKRGGPRIPPVAVTEENLNDLADRQARAFLAEPANVDYDAPNLRLTLSPVVLRHRSSIERDYTTVWIFLEKYLPPRESDWMKRRLPRLKRGPFDSRLDAIRRERPAAAPDSATQEPAASAPEAEAPAPQPATP